jgi:hypothetical protein
MRFLLDLTSRRTTRLLAASALLIGVGGATMAASSASAAACGPTTFTTTNCSMTGSADITAGSLGLAAPADQTWPTTALSGVDLTLVDTTDSSFSVQDITGSGDGWNVTATATPFTVGTSATVLANAGTLVFNGSTSTDVTGATPDNACAGTTTCTPATSDVTFPVDLTTDSGTTTSTIYNAATSSGMGNIVIGGAGNPAAWWLNVPAGAVSGTYTSQITLTIASGPTAT